MKKLWIQTLQKSWLGHYGFSLRSFGKKNGHFNVASMDRYRINYTKKMMTFFKYELSTILFVQMSPCYICTPFWF